MSFFNQYNKENYRTAYYNTKKIGNHIYSVGYIIESDIIIDNNYKGLITKLDVDGNLIWEKKYDPVNFSYRFVDIIECDNGDLLVLSEDAHTLSEIVVIRINPEGELIWSKLWTLPSLTVNYEYRITNLLKISGDAFLLLISPKELSNNVTFLNCLFKFDNSGNVIAQKTIVTDGHLAHFNKVSVQSNKLVFCGELYENPYLTTQYTKGLIIELDFNLNVLDKYAIIGDAQNKIINVKYSGSDIIIFGVNYDVSSDYSDRIYFGKINAQLVGSSTLFVKLSSQGSWSYNPDCFFNNQNIYLTKIGRLEEEVVKTDYNFNVLWRKSITSGITNRFIHQVTNNEILLSSGFDRSYVACLDLDLNSCLTRDIPLIDFVDKTFTVIKDFSCVAENTNYSFDNHEIFVSNVISDKKEICPTIPENPCIKDEKLCKLYSDIIKVVSSCLPDPTKLDERHDFKPQKECVQAILSLLQNYDKESPQYDLIKLLEQEIRYIKFFIEKVDFETYVNAWNAIQSILNYLSQQGNCNCENNLNLTDSASIQSGHLYLQSVGSTGSDSTKGMHLRWALRGALFQHLPKANYATNNNHFNKPNDFVKIYRANYKPIKVVLNFVSKPIQITETANQKNWLYNVDGKIFHIHFRNKTKYNQVRANINPMSDPQTFIKNYGDALLEIENKTELSFKITPGFEIIDTDSFVKLEVLSVLENKITAPKVASIRKKYATSDLNQNPLISENIRSIRFSSTNSFVTKLEFEFYSDFILNTKKANGWNYLGKYALTKETFEAYKRLEPQPHCLDKWLRYNDQACVRVENYKDKWNGSTLEPLNRIVTSVEKYIELSDEVDNVRAIEIFPFDDQDAVNACAIGNEDYDPLMVEENQLPDENTGVEISYLDVLQMGSLDFHVARMVGLGTLDLNSLVFDGKYIYLSEYITHGDLLDGLGTRQVQHLYCSLPTSLEDSRDCLAVDLQDPVAGVFYNTGIDGQEIDTDDDEDIPDEETAPAIQLTNQGYSFDGKTKYFTFYTEPFDDEIADAPFYYIDTEFESSKFTNPVFAGFEYRKDTETNWVKPEVMHSDRYKNNDGSGVSQDKTFETVELLVPENGKALYTHAVRESCTLIFSSYGINWFSRATSSHVTKKETIVITPANNLLPPTNVTATLIQKENPLFLTTSSEQALYNNNVNTDKTLVRLTFEYDAAQELIDYHKKINGVTIDNYTELDDIEEPFADSIQIFFRNQIPSSIAGKISSVAENGNPLLLTLETSEYVYVSTGETVTPIIPNGLAENYVGSIMLVDEVEYVIHEVDTSSTYPKFTIFKSDASGALVDLNTIVAPNIEWQVPSVGSFFMVVENMQNVPAWGDPNPSVFEVDLGYSYPWNKEEILVKSIDCTVETHVQKFRGVFQDAKIEKIFEDVDLDDDPDTAGSISMHRGLYKVTFEGFPLAQHPQHQGLSPSGNFVEWYNGNVRIQPLSDIGNGPRKNFKVVRTENIGITGSDLILYIEDLTFPTDTADLANYEGKIMSEDPNVIQITQKVNYYPGYKVYLYQDTTFGLVESNVLPEADEDYRYTIFGLRSRDVKDEFPNDSTEDYFSKISAPTLMFAQAVREPLPPQLPLGGLYATRPDFFGKSSYTFTTEYGLPNQTQVHKPYSVQFNRASDIQFLSAIYDNTAYGYDQVTHEPILNTVQIIMKDIFKNGEEPFYVNRWNNLLGFNYSYTNTPPTTPANVDGTFEVFDGVQLPLPNNPNFIASINAFVDAHNEFYHLNNTSGQLPHISIPNFNLHTVVIPEVVGQNDQLLIKDFLKDVLLNCFVPLTELPIIFDYVKGGDYKPIPKKQVVRDRNGNLIKPDINNPEFDMAPMMKRIDPPSPNPDHIPYKSQFTDFGLDGASTAKYFYAVREINLKLKTSDYSPILGPVSLVNTAPPIAPEIIKIIPVIENRTLDIQPAIQLQINAYPKVHNIKKINIYRADNANDALFIRSMKLVKVVDIESEGLADASKWIFTDDFIDLPEVPYGDLLYYRMTVSREIKYNDKYYDPIPANSNDQPIVDYAPSEASKLVITNIVENYSPDSPVMGYASEPLNTTTGEIDYVVLNWNETVYKGNYHLYKMNAQGNWVEICRVNSDRAQKGKYYVFSQDATGNWVQNSEINSSLSKLYVGIEATNLNQTSLLTKTSDGAPSYHHFKVIAENTAGMLSSKENILTIYNADSWTDNGGIAPDSGIDGMIVQGTFIVRPD